MRMVELAMIIVGYSNIWKQIANIERTDSWGFMFMSYKCFERIYGHTIISIQWIFESYFNFYSCGLDINSWVKKWNGDAIIYLVDV